MAGRLQTEIRQSRPFARIEDEAYLNIQRTAWALERGVWELLKPVGLSPTQYNVLRILRGAGNDGLPCGEIAARMVTGDPDVTRLVDRLEKRGQVRRERDGSDRRVVKIRITADGLELLARFDAPLRALHSKQLAHLGKARLETLVALLETARESTSPRE